MKKEKWYEDQPVLKTDLERAQGSKEEAISERLLDTFTPGVLLGSQLLGEAAEFVIVQGPNAGLFVTVNTGVAFSPVGERIVIPSVTAYNSAAPSSMVDNGIGGTVLAPASTGSQNIPVTNNTTNRIWLGYLETVDTSVFSLKEDTNERLFVKRDDGFEIVVTATATNPDSSRFVLIGEVVAAGGVVTTINTTNSKESQSVGPTPIPGSPYQIVLPQLPNLSVHADRPASIPAVAGFTYTSQAPAAGEFTVDFKTATVTFNAADTGTNVTITYLAQHTRREICLSHDKRIGGYVTLNSKPSAYAVGSFVTLEDHLNARGSGTVSPSNPHGLDAVDIGLAGVLDIGGKLAVSGIITPTGDVGLTASALSPSAVSAFAVQDNKVTIAPLIAGETLNISGTLVTSADIPATLTADFIDPDTLLPLPAGTYTFYVDKATKGLVRTSGTPPVDSFPVASIAWDGSKLLLPITDLRTFGTTGKANLRLETLLALATGAATDNRMATVYAARLIGSVAVTAPSYAFSGLGGTTLNITVDGTPDSVTFAALPANTTISAAVAAINAQVSGIKAVKTPTNEIKLLAPVSLVVTGGTAAPILGFPVSPALGSSDSGNIKEIRIGGSTSSTGAGEELIDAEVSFTYDITPQQKLTQVIALMGNRVLTTDITYNTDDTVKTVQETVS